MSTVRIGCAKQHAAFHPSRCKWKSRTPRHWISVLYLGKSRIVLCHCCRHGLLVDFRITQVDRHQVLARDHGLLQVSSRDSKNRFLILLRVIWRANLLPTQAVSEYYVLSVGKIEIEKAAQDTVRCSMSDDAANGDQKKTLSITSIDFFTSDLYNLHWKIKRIIIVHERIKLVILTIGRRTRDDPWLCVHRSTCKRRVGPASDARRFGCWPFYLSWSQ